MTFREQLAARRLQWQAFNRWEEQQPPIERDAAHIIADLGVILSWVTEEERLRDPDPEKRGIQSLRAACAMLGRRV